MTTILAGGASRRRVRSLGVFAVSLGIALYSAWTIAVGAYGKTGKVCGGILLTLLCIFTLRDWRVGVLGFFVWINFEDLVRKYSGNDLWIYFVKDIIVAVSYASFFWRRKQWRREGFKTSLRIPLLLWFGWALVEAWNPDISSLAVPLLGIRMSFFYIPMLYLGFNFADNESRLKTFMIVMLSFAAFVGLGGVAQSMLGLQFLNPEESSEYLRLNEIREFGDAGLQVPRVTSVFVDPGRYSEYLFVMFFLGIGLLAFLYKAKTKNASPWVKVWAWVCWLIAIGGLFISGQKAVILWMVLTPGAFLCVYILQKRFTITRAVRTLPWKGMILGSILVLAVLGVFFPERFEASYKLYWTRLSPWSPEFEGRVRPQSYWQDIVSAAAAAPFIGHGTGTASLGLQYLPTLKSDARMVNCPEGGYAGVLWEWGIGGLILWLWWTTRLLYELLNACGRLRGTEYHSLAVSVLACAACLLCFWFYLGFQVYQQFVSQALLWFLSGMTFSLPALLRARRVIEHR